MSVGYRINRTKLNALTTAVDESGRDLEREIAAVVNATATKTMGLMAKGVTREIAVKQKSVKKTLTKGKRATPQFPNTSVTLRKTSRLSLREFKPRQTKKGVSYKISKTGGRKKITTAFVNQTKLYGHVFVRKGSKRLPLQKLWGPSPWGVFVKQNMTPETTQQVEAEMLTQLDRRINFNKLKASGEI